MVDVKKAVEAASRAAASFFPQIPPESIRLEEVELSDEEWRITLSFLDRVQLPPTVASALAQITGSDYERRYKLFVVDTGTGEVRAMKIRPVEHEP